MMSSLQTRENDLALLDQMFGSFFDWQWPAQRYAYFSPPFDLYEKDDKYVLEMAAPGFEPKEIDVEVRGATVTVSATHPQRFEKKDAKYYRREMTQNSFTRTITLPQDLDPEAVTASMDKGVLKIELTPLKPVSAKKIEVKST
jgi:HSP20 family protein